MIHKVLLGLSLLLWMSAHRNATASDITWTIEHIEAAEMSIKQKMKFASYHFNTSHLQLYKNGRLEADDFNRKGTFKIPLAGKNTNVSMSMEVKDIGNTKRIHWKASDTSINKVSVTIRCEDTELFMGGGEQYSHFVLNGHTVPIWVEEQGIGRGDAPITFFAKLLKASGNPFTTYAPIPFFISTEDRAFFIHNTEFAEVHFKKKGAFTVTVWANELDISVYTGKDPTSILQQFTEDQGRMPELPEWAYGSWLGIQGGRKRVEELVDQSLAYDHPVSAIWIQDWVGKRATNIGSRLWWDWRPDSTSYPNIKEFCSQMEDKGIKVLGYINPFLAEEASTVPYAIEHDLLVKNEENEAYLMPAGGFNTYLFDLTNPATVKWLKETIRTQMIENGFDGWMADFGEWLPLDAKLHNGANPFAYHNQYPVDWTKLNRELIDELDRKGDLLLFNRSGFSGSAKYSTLFWEGDQLVTYQKNDGMKSAITAMHSSGMSGISLNHSDIGGYTSIAMFPIRKIRSRDLMYRWTEMNAFTPIFRTHEGLKPKKNFQFYDDEEAQQHFARMANIHKAISPYIKGLVKEASTTGLPVCRHPYLVFPDDEEVLDHPYQFLLGDDVLVKPISSKKKKKTRAYLPEGDWVHVWTGQKCSGKNQIKIDVPYGEPAVFIRKGEEFERLMELLKPFVKE